jgi:hypothetical protein
VTQTRHHADAPTTGTAKLRVESRWGRPLRYVGYLGGLCGPDAAKRNDAAQAVVDQAEHALNGSYTPTFIRVSGVDTALLVFRDPHAGWVYRIVDLASLPHGECQEQRIGYTCSGDWTDREAVRAGRRHLAQYLQGSGVAFEVAVTAIDPADREGRQEFAELEGFQRAYRAARAHGIAEERDEARCWAYAHAKAFTPVLPDVTTASSGERRAGG